MSFEDGDIFSSVPLRIGLKDRPDWTLCSTYLKEHFSESFSESFTRVHVFKSMNELHRKLVEVFQPSSVCTCFNDAFVEEVAVPYCKLVVQAQGHFPLQNGKVSREMVFAWGDSFPTFDKGATLSSGKHDKKETNATTSICVMDSNIEVFSCIYNLGAAYSELAADLASTGNAGKLKTGYTHFQQSAGFFQMLEEHLASIPGEAVKKINELQNNSVTALKRMCLAEAHHCGYLSAKITGKPDSLLSKLAVKAAELYEDLQLRKTPVHTSPVGQSLSAQVEASALVFRARSHLHLAAAAEKDTEMGLAIAHYYESTKFLDRISFTLLSALFKSWIEKLQEATSLALSRAEKANNTVCRQAVPTMLPSPAGLPKALGGVILHSSSFLEVEESTKENDPFWGIIAATSGSSEELQKWRSASEELLKRSSSRATAMREEVASSLQQLGVANYISIGGGCSTSKNPDSPIPQHVIEQLQIIRQDSDNGHLVSPLLAKLKFIDATKDEILEKVEQSENILSKVACQDGPYIQKYGEVLWRSEFPEISKTETFLSLIALLDDQKKSINRSLGANLSDAKKEMYEEAANLSLLEMSLEELTLLIPSMKYNESFRALCSGLESLVRQKNAIELAQTDALTAARTIIDSDKLAQKLTSTSKEHQEIVFSQETSKINGHLSAADKCNGDLEALLRKAEEKMLALAEIQSTDTASVEGQRILNDLLLGVTIYPKIVQSINAAVNCVNQSAERVNKIVDSVDAFKNSQAATAVTAQKRLDAKISQKMENLSSSGPPGVRNSLPTYCPPESTVYLQGTGEAVAPSPSSLQKTMNSSAQTNYYSLYPPSGFGR